MTNVDDPVTEPSGDDLSALTLARAATNAHFEDDVRAIIGRAMASNSDKAVALRSLISMFDRYLGDNDTSFYFAGLLAYGDTADVDASSLARIGDDALADELRAITKRLGGVFGTDIAAGIEVLNRGSHDWEYADVKTLYHSEKQVWQIKLALTTLDQDVLNLECSPLSMLRLVNRILPSFSTVGSLSGDFVGIFDQAAIDGFVDSAQALMDGIRNQLEATQQDDDTGVQFVAQVAGIEAATLADEVTAEGGVAELPTGGTEEVLPLLVLLAVAIPPGLGILATVVNKIVHSWKDHGTVLDARGDGPPVIAKADDLPHGTVVILTRDGDKAQRTDLPTDKLSDYVAAALGAVSGGASAADSDAAASAAIGT